MPHSDCDGRAPLLAAVGLTVGYGSIPVLRDVDLEVGPGEVVALLGANGAGKSTTLLALAGELLPTSGEVRLANVATRAPLHRRVRAGLGFLPEQRALIPGLSVRDNLRLGRHDVETALDIFPALKPLVKRPAGLLSGGEQQMLGIAQAIAAGPKVLLIDELSMGLAPIIVREILSVLRRLVTERQLGLLIVEQQTKNALAVADRAYVLRRGQVALSGNAADLRDRIAEIEAAYLADG